MRTKKEPPRTKPSVEVLRKAIILLQKTTAVLVSAVSRTAVASDDERKAIDDGLNEVMETMKAILTRAALVNEDRTMWMEDEIKLGLQFGATREELSYAAEIASVMLAKLRQSRHLTTRQHSVLARFWDEILRQHDDLTSRWDAARNAG